MQMDNFDDLLKDIHSGLFYIEDLSIYKGLFGSGYFRPNHITITSSPYLKIRVVSYKMGCLYTKEQPDTIEDYKRMNPFKSRLTGATNFQFNIECTPITGTELLNKIRYHFFSIVLKSNVKRSKDDIFYTLKEVNNKHEILYNDVVKATLSDIVHNVIICFNRSYHHIVKKENISFMVEYASNLSQKSYDTKCSFSKRSSILEKAIEYYKSTHQSSNCMSLTKDSVF